MRILRPGTIFVLSIILSAGIFAMTVMAEEFGEITAEEWTVQAPPDSPEAGAIVLFDNAEMRIGGNVVEIMRHKRIKVLTPEGIKEVQEQGINYFEKYDNIKNLKAHVITTDGQEYKVAKEEIHTYTGDGGKNRKVFTFTGLTPGCIIEYSYTHTSKRLRDLEPWYFQGPLYTLKSRLTADIRGYGYRIGFVNIPSSEQRPEVVTEPHPEFDHDVGITIQKLIWRLKNLPPVTEEPFMCSETDYRSSLTFTLVDAYGDGSTHTKFTRDWGSVGKQYQHFLNKYSNNKKDVKKLVEKITDGIANPKAKSRALYDYVAREFKTIQSGSVLYFHNKEMDNFMKEKAGSPEEKNYLLALMLQDAGLSSWPTLISRRSHGRVNKNFPDESQFDYLIAIVQFDDGWEFLDVSDQFSPYGILPPDCLTDRGLMLQGEESQLINLTTVPTTSYRLDVTNMYLDPLGAAVCSTECLLTGYSASQGGQDFENEGEEKFIDAYFLNGLEGTADVDSYSFKKDSNYTFRTYLNYRSSELVGHESDKLVINPVSYQYHDNPFTKKKRFFPVDFNYPFTYHNIFNFFFDGKAADIALPEDFEVDINGATLIRQSQVLDTVVTVGFQLQISNPIFVPRAYSDLKDLFDKLALSKKDKILIYLTGND